MSCLLRMVVITAAVLQSQALGQGKTDNARLDWPIEVILTRLSPVYDDSLVDFSGVLLDSLTHDVLVGANLVVVGTRLGSASNRKGEVTLNGLPLTRTLRITYVGYDPKNLSVRSLGSLSTHLPLPMKRDSIMAPMDSTDIMLVRRSLEENLFHLGHMGGCDTTGARCIFLLDSLIQPRMIPMFPDGRYRVVSLEKLNELARRASERPHGAVYFDAFGGIVGTATVKSIVIRQLSARYLERRGKVAFYSNTEVTFRYRVEGGQWVGGAIVAKIHDFAVPGE